MSPQERFAANLQKARADAAISQEELAPRKWAARLAPEIFALALPATRGASARLTAERIAAVIGCTAFDAGPERPPFVVEFEVGSAELQPGESPAALLERASAAVGAG